jgi:hypothetical protein
MTQRVNLQAKHKKNQVLLYMFYNTNLKESGLEEHAKNKKN